MDFNCANTPSSLLVVLDEKIQEQKDCSNETDTAVYKLATKTALHSLLDCISHTPKDDLMGVDRQLIDSRLHSVCNDSPTILKWPLLRALENPRHYRALLGLTQTLEETRRFLTQAPPKKVQEIMQTCGTNVANANHVETLQWIEQVLTYLTGDGRRKKELDGFVLLDKNAVRAARNKGNQRASNLKKMEAASATKKNTYQINNNKAVFIDRDVRIMDQERQAARANDFGSLVDGAIRSDEKTKEKK